MFLVKLVFGRGAGVAFSPFLLQEIITYWFAVFTI